ncbi:hypothetical protein HGA91_06470 [candidate division WWE3 bacterium]|nr:hypothetical protein [candidate division WWE3 bacterium]
MTKGFLDKVKLAKGPDMSFAAFEQAFSAFDEFNANPTKRFVIVFLWPMGETMSMQGLNRPLDYAFAYVDGSTPIPYRLMEIGLGWNISSDPHEISIAEFIQRLTDEFGDRFAGIIQASGEFWRLAELAIEASKGP